MQYNQLRGDVLTLQHAPVADMAAEDAIKEASKNYLASLLRGEHMSRSKLDAHFGDLEQQIRSERRFHEDCFANSGDIKFKVSPMWQLSDTPGYGDFLDAGTGNDNEDGRSIDIVLRVRDRQNKVWFLIPTARAWRQIQKTLNFPKSFFDNLAKAGNFQLLAENLTFFWNDMGEQDFLLRMVGFDEQRLQATNCGEQTPYLLRAFLPPKFCRMDNVYLCNALKMAIAGTGQNVANIRSSLERDGGDMLVDVEFAEMKELRKLNEKYVTGIRIKASEIGSYEHVTVQVMLKRLVCLNGMTVDGGGGTTYISYYQSPFDTGKERFQNLPEFPMPGKFATQQEKIEGLISKAINACCGDMDKLLGAFEGRLNRLLEEAEAGGEKFNSDEDIKAAIKYILQRAGLLVIGGVSVERVFEYYLQERAVAASPHNIAWLLINAITRYATHYMMRGNLDNAQIIQSRIYSHVLNPSRMTWGNISQYVKDEREKVKSEIPGVKV